MNGRMRVCVYVCQTLTIKRHSAPASENKRDNFFCNPPRLSVRHTGQKRSRCRVRESTRKSTWSALSLTESYGVFANFTRTRRRPCVELCRRIILANLFSLRGRSHERFFLTPPRCPAGAGFYLFVSRPAELVLKCVAVRALRE